MMRMNDVRVSTELQKQNSPVIFLLTCSSSSEDAISWVMRPQLHRPLWNGLPSPLWCPRPQLPGPGVFPPSTLGRSGAAAGTARRKTQTWSRDPETWGSKSTSDERKTKKKTCTFETDLCLRYSPIDRSAGDDRAEESGYKRVVELRQQPARLLHTLLEKSLGVRVQVALDEEGLHWFSEQFRTALIPLQPRDGKEMWMRELKNLCTWGKSPTWIFTPPPPNTFDLYCTKLCFSFCSSSRMFEPYCSEQCAISHYQNGHIYCLNHCLMYESLHWLAPKVQFQWSLFIFKCIYFSFPPYLKHFLIPFRIEIGCRAFRFKAPSDCNNLPCSLRSITSFHVFKLSLPIHLQTFCSCFWFLLFSSSLSLFPGLHLSKILILMHIASKCMYCIYLMHLFCIYHVCIWIVCILYVHALIWVCICVHVYLTCILSQRVSWLYSDV